MDQYLGVPLSAVFNALGDPNRLAIVQRTRKGEVPVSDLAKELNITLTATLKHLSVLEKAGVVRTRKVGRERRCELELASLSPVEAWIRETRREWSMRLDSLERFLDTEEN